jgi:hypothetical protein
MAKALDQVVVDHADRLHAGGAAEDSCNRNDVRLDTRGESK